MSVLFIMVGLPCSGKTAKAKEISKKEKAYIFSSGEYRGNFLDISDIGLRNNEAFKTLYKDLEDCLESGQNAILDATNVSMNARARALAIAEKHACDKRACVLSSSVHECLKRNKEHLNPTPASVIFKFARSFQFPQYFEGFDSISVEGWGKTPPVFDKNNYDAALNMMRNFDLGVPNQKYDLLEHSMRVAERFTKDSIEYQAGIFHDFAKSIGFVKSRDGLGGVRYYSHENISTLYLLQNLDVFKVSSWNEIYEILFLINEHMHAKWIVPGSKSWEKYEKIFGKDRLLRLKNFREADDAANKN